MERHTHTQMQMLLQGAKQSLNFLMSREEYGKSKEKYVNHMLRPWQSPNEIPVEDFALQTPNEGRTVPKMWWPSTLLRHLSFNLSTICKLPL